ncbi:hypothetical protein DMB90_10845 [Raoultella planticola]|uniref:Uncharacterized protein n=1 Tax=Raoultella planticola TaxID=575 RepID=A0A5P6AA60_RAOPL|nr:hypothetical protein DMB90_10845 [Raoultella planticola]
MILPVPDPGAPRPFDRSDSGRLSARYLGGTPRRPTCIYAATLLNRSRIGVMERNVDPAPNHLFWLQYRDNTGWRIGTMAY